MPAFSSVHVDKEIYYTFNLFLFNNVIKEMIALHQTLKS